MKHSRVQELNMKSGSRPSSPSPPRLTLDLSVILLVLWSLATGQESSDCRVKPQSEVGEGVTALECDLKTLQTGPSDIPQVRLSLRHSLFELRLDGKKVFLLNLTIYKCCNLL